MISKIGIDPGSVNFSIGKIIFKGFKYNEDRTIEIPIFYPCNWEHWNLKTGVGLRNSTKDGGKFEKFHIIPPDEQTEEDKINTKDSWTARLNHFIIMADWIFDYYNPDEEKKSNNTNRTILPSVVVENQFDHIESQNKKKEEGDKKNKPRWDMFRISNEFSSAIRMHDSIHERAKGNYKLYYRDTRKKSLKFGMRNDGKRLYIGRKEDSVSIMIELFKILGLDGWIEFLESIRGTGQKIDDLCDAILLALQSAIEDYENEIKLNRKLSIQSSKAYINESKLGSSTSCHLRDIPIGNININVFPLLISEKCLDDSNVDSDDDDDDDDNNSKPFIFPSDDWLESYDSLINKTKQTSSKPKATRKRKIDTIDTNQPKPKRVYKKKKLKNNDEEEEEEGDKEEKPKEKRVYKKRQPKNIHNTINSDTIHDTQNQPKKRVYKKKQNSSEPKTTITTQFIDFTDDIEDDDI